MATPTRTQRAGLAWLHMQMKLHVSSKLLAADVAVLPDAPGSEHLVMMAKATWRLPGPGERPSLAPRRRIRRTISRREGDRSLVEANPHNPAGVGWAGPRTLVEADGKPARHLEHPGDARGSG